MNKFIEYNLEDILTFKYGKDQKKIINDKGKYPILGTGGIIGWTNSFLYNKPSVLLGRKGTINNPFFMDKPFWTIDTLFYTEINENKINPKYLFYRFKIINFLRYNEATGVPSLKTDTLNRIPIKIHTDLITQEKIASVLSTLDKKIEINNRINEELEAMAKTLYDYWFVQFEFPFDFAQGNPSKEGKPYKSSGGKMVWNEELKREIPEGWENGKLSDLANITMGQSPDGESYNENGNGVIFFQGCTDFGTRFPSVRKFTTKPTRFAKSGDILLSVRAPVGSINIANENCCIGRGLASLNSKNNSNAFLFYVLKNLKQVFDRRNSDGTTFGSITKDDLFSLKVTIPNKKILKKYSDLIESSFEKQNKISLETQKLEELRDWLLPMLMNGQVSVN